MLADKKLFASSPTEAAAVASPPNAAMVARSSCDSDLLRLAEGLIRLPRSRTSLSADSMLDLALPQRFAASRAALIAACACSICASATLLTVVPKNLSMPLAASPKRSSAIAAASTPAKYLEAAADMPSSRFSTKFSPSACAAAKAGAMSSNVASNSLLASSTGLMLSTRSRNSEIVSTLEYPSPVIASVTLASDAAARSSSE